MVVVGKIDVATLIASIQSVDATCVVIVACDDDTRATISPYTSLVDYSQECCVRIDKYNYIWKDRALELEKMKFRSRGKRLIDSQHTPATQRMTLKQPVHHRKNHKTMWRRKES